MPSNAEKLDEKFPISCYICHTTVKRVGNTTDLICPKCKASQNDVDAYFAHQAGHLEHTPSKEW